MLAIEEWGHADACMMQHSYAAEVFISRAGFTYGIDAHCQTCVGCALMEALLEQGHHLTHGYSNLKPVHQIEIGGTVAA